MTKKDNQNEPDELTGALIRNQREMKSLFRRSLAGFQLSQFSLSCLNFCPVVSIFGWMSHFLSSCLGIYN
ncbi:hypothetical protein V9T40_001841 [Parthenolecanium corni]|uniref:Uncharacterized protein n=1 Tax=Parthenolecanium corni TaxID=536013 RepID=A0AAN9TJS1_9HEMI